MPRALRADELLDAVTVASSRWPAAFADWLLVRIGEVDDAAPLTLGERDARLAGVRAASFGERLEFSAACPACAARLDVTLGTGDLPTAGAPAVAELAVAGLRCRVHPVTAADLASIADVPDEELACALLAERCLEPLDGELAGPLEPADVAAVAEVLASLDPAADPYVALSCAACPAQWDAPIDLAQLLAHDVTRAAVGLIDDVHDLAVAYNWSEAAILALPAARRHAYLSRVRG